VVRDLSDDEALEIAITENLQRRDVSPIEEAVAYKRLADTGRYDTASLAVRFGKSESYIRGRMRLNELTDEVLRLVDEDAISVSVALELCKYSRETQEVICQRHLCPDAMYNDNWLNLTAKEFVKRLESRYCTDLSRYRFDKSECVRCPFNTDCYNLFPEEGRGGKCLNGTCLAERNRQFLVSSCLRIVAEHPDVEICRPMWGNNNEDVYAELSEQGYTVDTGRVQSFPEQPEPPVRENFEDDEDFAEAQADFDSEVAEYQSEVKDVERMLADGRAKRIVTIDGNGAGIGYIVVPTAEETARTAGKDDADPVAKLRQQDKRNREIAVERIVEDTRQMLRKTEIPRSAFTAIEDKYLYYTMLSDLKREHIAILTGDPKNDRWYLSEEEKIEIIGNLTEERKTLIRRDFLTKHLSDTFGVDKKSYLMLEFARLHFPDELAETETKYNDVYTKRHKRIEERLNALQAGTEVNTDPEDAEETPDVA
jgi:ParB family chromosome partitioning protein